MYHVITVAAILIATFYPPSLHAQNMKSPDEPAVFSYKNGKSVTHQINIHSLLIKNKIELTDHSLPDTTGLESITADGSYFLIVRQPQNPQRPHLIIKKIMDGKIELFSTPEASIFNSFFARKDGVLRELKSYRKYVNVSEFVEVKEYQSVLKYLFMDCPEISSTELDKLRLNLKAIEPLINRYNQYFDPSTQPLVAGEKDKWFRPSAEFSFLLGYMSRSFEMNHLHSPYNISSPMNANSPTFGISLAGKTNRLSKFDFVVEFMFGKIDAKSSKRRFISDGNYHISEFNYDFSHSRNNVTVRYNFVQTKGLRIALGVGGSMHWSGANKSRASTRYIMNSNQVLNSSRYIEPKGASGYVPMASISFHYKAFELRYNYSSPNQYFRDWEEPSGEHLVLIGLNLSKVLKKKQST